uniref:Uncharacterized protein n=1 Tax=Helianthus annuus TaxID=4232 RepID=A0A251T0E8_HELAN
MGLQNGVNCSEISLELRFYIVASNQLEISIEFLGKQCVRKGSGNHKSFRSNCDGHHDQEVKREPITFVVGIYVIRVIRIWVNWRDFDCHFDRRWD